MPLKKPLFLPLHNPPRSAKTRRRTRDANKTLFTLERRRRRLLGRPLLTQPQAQTQNLMMVAQSRPPDQERMKKGVEPYFYGVLLKVRLVYKV